MLFHHHPDGRIFIRDDAGEPVYAATLDEFRDDLAALALPPYEGLPAGVRERRWQPGRHVVFTADGQDAGPDEWTADAYLAAADALAARAASRALGQAPPPGPDEVPREVSLFQARAAMRRHFLPDGRSLFAAVDQELRTAREVALSSGAPEDDPQRITAELHWQAWEYAGAVKRGSPLVAALAARFGLNEAQVDDLFRQAAGIEA